MTDTRSWVAAMLIIAGLTLLVFAAVEGAQWFAGWSAKRKHERAIQRARQELERRRQAAIEAYNR